MSKTLDQRPQSPASQPVRSVLLGGIGKSLATGLVMYRGWHS